MKPKRMVEIKLLLNESYLKNSSIVGTDLLFKTKVSQPVLFGAIILMIYLITILQLI